MKKNILLVMVMMLMTAVNALAQKEYNMVITLNNGTTVTQPEFGYYWSSTSNPDNIAKAYSTIFRNSNSAPGQNANADRYTGLPVRAVYSRN